MTRPPARWPRDPGTPSAFSVHDGMVDVIAQMQGGTIVSGGMAAVRSQTFGYFEFRVRDDTDPSTATDAVVLTWPDDGIWPQHGENDIYETGTARRAIPSIRTSTMGRPAARSTRSRRQPTARSGTSWGWSDWPIIGIYRDGALVGTVTDTTAIPMVNHRVCVQLDAYQATIGAPTHMYVDWVAVFQK